LIDTQTLSEPTAARSASHLLPSLGLLLVTGGLFLLLWVGYLWLKPEVPPYQYQLVEEGGVDRFKNLALDDFANLSISKFEIQVDSVDKPLAFAYRASRPGLAPVLLHLENQFPEPISSMEGMLSETTAVASAIARHVPKEAVILAWWDTSRKIALLSDRSTLFTSHLGRPVIAPSYWKGRLSAIESYEKEFWGAQGTPEENKRFDRFIEALMAYPNEGAAMLRELAGPREAYVVVHSSDIYKLGLMHPERIDVAFKDFPLTGNVHGLTGQVKTWLTNNNYNSYTLQSLSEKEVRAYFLRESGGSNILLAKMLPFSNSRPMDLEALQLIHKEGGYWIYKIPSADSSKG
jgi:hydroxylamine oxidation protein HaoB